MAPTTQDGLGAGFDKAPSWPRWRARPAGLDRGPTARVDLYNPYRAIGIAFGVQEGTRAGLRHREDRETERELTAAARLVAHPLADETRGFPKLDRRHPVHKRQFPQSPHTRK
jgi:hypothetical protein